MGTPIPDPIIPPDVPSGSSCAICWGVGMPFGDGDTPGSIFVSLSGISKGPDWFTGLGEPLSGDFEVFEDSACVYVLFVGDVRMTVMFTGTGTAVYVEVFGAYDMLVASVPDLCETFFLNYATEYFVGGSCKITIPGVEP